MKKLLLTLTVLFMTFSTMAQGTAAVLTIGDEKGTFVQSNAGSVTRLQVTASEEKIKALKAKISEIPYAKIEVKKASGDTYQCKLIITKNADPIAVQRVLGHAGFEQFTFKGSVKDGSELPGILVQLL